MTKKKIFLYTIITILVMSAPVSATDATLRSSTLRSTSWPQWRGPFFNGSTNEKNLPRSWSQTEGIAWVSPLPGPSGATPIIFQTKIEEGPIQSSIAIADGHLFIRTAKNLYCIGK